MAANEKATTETIVAQMSEILGKIDKLAHNSTPQDVAAAIGMIGDVEKAMRKIRGKWLQAIVNNAAQGGLPLR